MELFCTINIMIIKESLNFRKKYYNIKYWRIVTNKSESGYAIVKAHSKQQVKGWNKSAAGLPEFVH